MITYLCREVGDFNSALDYYNKFLSIDPSRGEIQQLKGMLLYKYGDIAAALESFKVSSYGLQKPCLFIYMIISFSSSLLRSSLPLHGCFCSNF